jgi:carbon monoxide dehydrogenase subunit G
MKVRMLKKILIGIAAITIALLLVVALRPAEVRVERTAAIAAPAQDVFARVNDFHQWQAWSPWAKLDPGAKETFEGARAGTGAVFAWSGSEVGEGRMTLTESRPSELIRIRTDYVRPAAGASTTEFTFRPQGSQTVVTWVMHGHHDFTARALGLFVNFDKSLGSELEAGLANLKSVTEAARKS